MENERPAVWKPQVWVLAGAHAGDTAQAIALADALGWPYEIKQLQFNSFYRIPNILLQASLRTLSPSARAALSGSVPDLVIAVGRRTAPVARAIRARAPGRVRLVHIGRPRAPLDWFDLVVTTPQYGLPERANVLHNPVPLTADPAAVAPEVLDRWRSTFAHLPRPWIAVLAGGSRAPYLFDAEAARALGRRASALATSRGGSLLVTTSPRTGQEAANALADSLTAPAYTYLWHPGGDNPYKAILRLADRFVVTGESVSMITEACRSGKPVQVFDVPRDGRTISAEGSFGSMRGRLTAWGILPGIRDVETFTGRLIRDGLIGPLEVVDFEPRAPMPDPMPNTVDRVRALFQVESFRCGSKTP
jgi:mitochondrial fission protein ELM1